MYELFYLTFLKHSFFAKQDELQKRMEKEKYALMNEVAIVQKERDDQLLMAENEKQEEMHRAANEKAMLVEKIGKIQNERDNASVEIDRLKREAFSRAEQDKAAITRTQDELRNTKGQLDENV